MMAAFPVHPLSCGPVGTDVLSGERLTRGVRRVAGVRPLAVGSYRSLAIGLSPAIGRDGMRPSWVNEHSFPIEGLRPATAAQRGTSSVSLPGTPSSARRPEGKDRKAQFGAGCPWGSTR